VIAQDVLGNITSSPSAGLVATDVNTVTTPPTTPYTYTINNSLSGTYTVGAGGAYTTITAAVAAYNVSCLGGPVVFSLIDATYPAETYPITINPNSFASSTNTLTIKPAVGVTGGLQPARLPELVNPDDADGFVDRVLFSWPKSEVPGWTEDEVDEKTETAFVAMFQRLSEYAERVYPLSTESKRVWVNWFNENTRITESLEGAGRGLSSKLPRQLARITLILHCMEEVYASQVSAATMRAAIEIVEYHREHGLRVLGAVSKIVEAGLKARIVRALSDSKCEVSSVSSVSSVEISFFISLCKCPTRVELHRLLGGHVLAADLDTAISSLEADGKVIRVPVPSTKAGGRPGERLHYLYEETEETEETPPNSVCHSCGQILRDLEKCDCGDTTPSLCPGCSLPLDARFTVRGHCPSCAAKQTAKGWH